MKVIITAFTFLIAANSVSAQQTNWKSVPGKITSPWADSINPDHVLSEYPRPQLQRSNWQNLNGLWQYAALPKPEADKVPASFHGNILVPFCIESALSGVGKTVGKDSILWYKRTININTKRSGKKMLLHFGAVDWRADVFVNGNIVSTHEGGYDPFTIDITSALKKGTKQDIAVRVWDPTDEGVQPHGKQVVKPESIWYTPVTGIWQTVWLETVPETFIASTKQTPDLDNKTISVSTSIQNFKAGDQITFTAWKGGEKVAEKTGTDTSAILTIDSPQTWSPSKGPNWNKKVLFSIIL